MKLVPIHRKQDVVAYAKVDDEDHERLAARRWVLSQYGYAVRYPSMSQDGFSRTIVFMHREVLGLPVGGDTHSDHVNRDRLDNRRSNLRPCTVAQNNQNRSTWGTSQHRGVCRARTKKVGWIAQAGGRYLGTYDTEIEAAWAAASYRKFLYPELDEPLLEAQRPATEDGSPLATTTVSLAHPNGVGKCHEGGLTPKPL